MNTMTPGEAPFLDDSDRNQTALLIERWKGLIDAPETDAKPITNYRDRANMAIVLQNQFEALQRNKLIPNSLVRENSISNFAGPFGYAGGTQANANATTGYTPGGRGNVGPGNYPGGNVGSVPPYQHPNDFYAPGDARVASTIMGLVRRKFPETVGMELVDTQPVRTPLGSVFGIRHFYKSDPLSVLGRNDGGNVPNVTQPFHWPLATDPKTRELGFVGLNTAQTGTSSQTSVPSGVSACFNLDPSMDGGVAALQSELECYNGTTQIETRFEKANFEVGTRKLSTKLSQEELEDTENMHGVDLKAEQIAAMSYELNAEISHEIVVRILKVCLEAGFGKGFTIFDPTKSSGRWSMEQATGLVMKIHAESSKLQLRNRNGRANFLVATPLVASVLRAVKGWREFDFNNEVDYNVGVTRGGTLDGIRVYIESRFASQYEYGMRAQNNEFILLGYKGTQKGDSGVVYAPYVPVEINKATGHSDFCERIQVRTRYAVIGHLWGASNYYHLIVVKNIQNLLNCDGALSNPTGVGGSPAAPFML